MSEERIKYLLSQYFNGTASLEDRRELLYLLRDSEQEEALNRSVERAWQSIPVKKVFTRFQRDKMIDSILEETDGEEGASVLLQEPASPPVPVARRVHFLRSRWLRYAAALLVLAGSAIWFLNTRRVAAVPATALTATPEDIEPGGNRAVLTLANGRVIPLDSVAEGALAQQGAIDIVKLEDGRLAYKAISDGPAPMPQEGANLVNTIRTPRRGQYQVILSDGTVAWLNAASSISFPAVFDGNERKIAVTGEVYLEVARNKSKPFIVTVNDMKVEVLGTSFNINAYDDEEAIKTSLVEGSVRVFRTGEKEASSVVLEPGWQAVMPRQSGNTGEIKRQHPDIQQAIAWKEGVFDFYNVPLSSVMRQIARWYDVDIVYPDTMPAIEIWGKMQRNLTLQQLLKVLEGMELKCTLDGRKLILR